MTRTVANHGCNDPMLILWDVGISQKKAEKKPERTPAFVIFMMTYLYGLTVWPDLYGRRA
ncbi:MAG: hypothetical protein CMM79_00545 [Rhodospirillaceae bacterium]|nr:hypothetical protein [Rhodospirillaceae bacterium]